MLLPEKAVTVGEPQEQKKEEESKEPHVVTAPKENSSFVQEITEQAEKFEEVSQVEEAKIVSMEAYITKQ